MEKKEENYQVLGVEVNNSEEKKISSEKKKNIS